jgi:hypothetical protein
VFVSTAVGKTQGKTGQRGSAADLCEPWPTTGPSVGQLSATVKTFSVSSNGDKTYAGCTKGITIFAVPWCTAEAINEGLAEDEYFEAATLKSVADIRTDPAPNVASPS